MTIKTLEGGPVDIDAVLADETATVESKRAQLLEEERRLRAIAESDRLRLGSGEAARLSKVMLALESLRRDGRA